MIEKRQFNTIMFDLIEFMRISDNEKALIKKDPNFTLPIWLMFKNCDIELLNKVIKDMQDDYNPKKWRGEKSTVVDGKRITFFSQFPFPGEFKELKEKYYVHTRTDTEVYYQSGAPETTTGDGEGQEGLAEAMQEQIARYKAMSPEEKKIHIETMKDKF